MEDGFYKFEDGNWQYAPNFVYGPGYELTREKKDEYSYPVEGWSWYNESPIENESNNDNTIDAVDQL
jgi:hypothetical protein